MQRSFSVEGRGSTGVLYVFPPHDVSDGTWAIALKQLTTYNRIPNIEQGVNDTFYYGETESITIPEGAYEIEDIERYIKESLDDSVQFSLKANNNTIKCEIECSETIHFDKEHTMAKLLGFSKKVLQPNTKHESDLPVNIINVDVIRVECNISRGSFSKVGEGHVIHEFYPLVPPGFKMVETPTNLLYLPLNCQSISNITITLKDQDGKLLNLQSEPLTVHLEIKKIAP